MHPANSKEFKRSVSKTWVKNKTNFSKCSYYLRSYKLYQPWIWGRYIYIFFHYFTLPICPFFSGRSTCSQISHSPGILKLIPKDIKARTFRSPVSLFKSSQSYPCHHSHQWAFINSPQDFPIFSLKPLCCLFNCWTPKGFNCITITKIKQ